MCSPVHAWSEKGIAFAKRKHPIVMADKSYLGFDFSTQQIKVIAVSENLVIIYKDHVTFHTDLAEFKTSNGVHIHADNVTVTAPTVMWVKALDQLLTRMKSRGFDFSSVNALSGDAQQCSSVYWKMGAQKILSDLKTDQPMHEQLKDVFSIPDSPTWMDVSTTTQCRQLEAAVGGPEELAQITGSRGYEHFTGNQIMKIHQTNKEGYHNTERISLVSSFAASLFLGDYAAIDYSDGAGMNLLDINNKSWSSKCLDACAPGLADKLGEPVPSHTVLGNISSYLVGRYGFSSNCKVVAFTGDNLGSLAGLARMEGDTILSLGTSDTLNMWLRSATPGLNGHVFVNPLDPDAFVVIICFKNGSIPRERIMQQSAGGSWERFSEILKQTPPGNHGNIGIYFDMTEIQPVVKGVFRFRENDKPVSSFLSEVEVRAVIESQFLSRLMYAQYCGLQIGPSHRLIATGGASVNREILQVVADIFNTTVYAVDEPNSAALGNCYRAKHGLQSEGTPFSDVVKGLKQSYTHVVKPTPGLQQEVYGPMLERYRRLEQVVVAQDSAK